MIGSFLFYRMGILNRRHIRVKVLQEVYAFLQSEKSDIRKGKENLLQHVDKIHELYVLYLSIFPELRKFSIERVEGQSQRYFKEEEKARYSRRFADNPILKLLDENKELDAHIKDLKINWHEEDHILKKIYETMLEDEYFRNYLNGTEKDFEVEKDAFLSFYKTFVYSNELLIKYLEDSSIFWQDDIELIQKNVAKTLKQFDKESDDYTSLLPLYKDPDDDKDFMLKLFEATLKEYEESMKLVSSVSKNWDIDRIALMDRIILALAIAEAKTFMAIPTRVTLNEYIEVSKFYSTPKSKTFINGILDKVFAKLTEEGKLKKLR